MKTMSKALSSLLRQDKVEKKLTPAEAKKLAKKAIVKPTTYSDCLDDIELRAVRGYTWTVMLSVDNNTLHELTVNGWKTKTMSTNHASGSYMVRIEW